MNFGKDDLHAHGRFAAVMRLAIVRRVGAAAGLFAPVQYKQAMESFLTEFTKGETAYASISSAE